jgi:hypothetical protein
VSVPKHVSGAKKVPVVRVTAVRTPTCSAAVPLLMVHVYVATRTIFRRRSAASACGPHFLPNRQKAS